MMMDFQQRVIFEHDALADKITKLSKFVEGSVFKALHVIEQDRLRVQLHYMDGYALTLRARIAAFPLVNASE